MVMHRKVKYAVAGILVAAVAALAVLFAGSRTIPTGVEALTERIPPGVNVMIRNLRHTANKDGKAQWHLEAESAQLVDDNTTARLTDIAVSFMDAGTQPIVLTAQNGTLHMETRDIVVQGRAVLTRGPVRLTTQRVEYGHGDRRIVAPTPVRLEGDSITITADRMSFDLGSRILTFEGNVYGTLDALVGKTI
jgi:LPS export ABC transporter protein LptC